MGLNRGDARRVSAGRYRWWTVAAWFDVHGAGVKLGPITALFYVGYYGDADRPARQEFFLGGLGRPWVDTGAARWRRMVAADAARWVRVTGDG